MPVKQCQANGVSGYKWGDEGKCYTGPDARAKAEAQGAAIEAAQNTRKFNHVAESREEQDDEHS